MTTLPRIVHLVDDTTPGGVMRVAEYLTSSHALKAHADHEIKTVKRARLLPSYDADIIVSHLTISWRTLPALITLRARNPGKKLVHVEHSYTESFTALNVTRTARFYTLLRVAFALFDQVVAVSENQGEWMRDRGLIGSSAVTVIPSAIDPRPYTNLPAPNHPIRTIGAIGRLDRQKGFDVLIEAFRDLPQSDISLEIYGDGPEREALERLARNDPRIRFHGYKAQPEDIFGAVDAVAMPSRWEAYGLVALEARAAGRPVLVAPVDGLRDQAKDGCLSVASFTPIAWRGALNALVSRNFPVLPRSATAAHAGEEFSKRWIALQKALLPQHVPSNRKIQIGIRKFRDKQSELA